MNRCETCTHFSSAARQAPYGSCGRWHRGYLTPVDTIGLDEVLVEDDEGWGMIVGPQFGCVLHEVHS